MKYKKCTKCGTEKPATTEYFYKISKNKNELRSKCKKCKRELARKRQHEKRYGKRKRLSPNEPSDYKVGQQIKVRRQITPQQKDTMVGWVAGVYDHLILVDDGKYRECFTYVDLDIGEAEIRK